MIKRKFLFVSLDALISDIAWKVSEEGHHIKYFIEDKDSKDIADGFVPKSENWQEDVSWADVVCYDKDTEILTKNGWKKFFELTNKTIIATLNPKTFELEYRKVNKLIKRKYEGDMIVYKSPENEFCVTPDHKMFVKDHKNLYTFKSAENIYKTTRKHIKLNCKWIGKKIKKIQIPDVEINWTTGNGVKRNFVHKGILIRTDYLMAIAGFYVSEGSIIRRWKNINGIRIYQNYGKYLEGFKQVLKKSGIGFSISKRQKGEEILIHNGALGKFLADNFGVGFRNKCIPAWAKELDSKYLGSLFDWLMNGDGHRGKHHSFYFSSSKKLLEDLQEILLKLGKAGRIRGNVISIIKNTEPRLKQKKYWSKKEYNDFVYCVEVDNHIIYVRRNGKPLWCGNCFDDVLGQGKKSQKLKNEGKLVIGGSEYTDKLEDDRAFGQNELKKSGVNIIPQENFKSFDDAISFVQQNPSRYVIKPSGEAQNYKQLLFVGEDEDGKDIIQVLEDYKKAWAHKIKEFQLQKRMIGVEVAVGAFFNGKEFAYPINVNFEHKKLFPGNIGPATGEMGTSVIHSGPNKLFNATLKKMEAKLAEEKYTGYMDINCIVNSHGIYPLEWTARFGYPIISIQQESMITPMGEVLHGLAEGTLNKFKAKSGFHIGVRVVVPPFPFKDKDTFNNHSKDAVILFKKPNREGVHIEDVKLVNGEWLVTGSSGVVLIVCGSGSTMRSAQKQAYNRIENIRIPNMYYRKDIGDRWYEDSDKLHTWGYLRENGS